MFANTWHFPAFSFQRSNVFSGPRCLITSDSGHPCWCQFLVWASSLVNGPFIPSVHLSMDFPVFFWSTFRWLPYILGFPVVLVIKNLPANAGDIRMTHQTVSLQRHIRMLKWESWKMPGFCKHMQWWELCLVARWRVNDYSDLTILVRLSKV